VKPGHPFFLQDTTARKEFENKLIENEKKYRLLFQNNPLPMIIIELDSYSILDVNQSAILNYGYSAEEFQHLRLEDLRLDSEKTKYLNFVKSVDENNFNAGVWTHMKKNGQLMQVEIIAYSMSINSKPCRLILCNDVTDKIKTQEEIKHSRDQLRQLSSHLEKVREDERTSIAREIHDELGQQLTGLKMDASWIAKKIKSDDETVNVKIEGMIRLIDDTVKTVRKIASELRPGILDDLGLVAALDWQSREFEKRTGINCSFSYDSLETNFNKPIATGIFRIYQEALTNVARHAKASAVVSSLRVTADAEVEMIISDNGIGIPQSNKERKTLGLIGMSERAIMLNGILKIHSNVGKGTTIKLKIPLQN
jgi:PAS domain S-box-containing protein